MRIVGWLFGVLIVSVNSAAVVAQEIPALEKRTFSGPDGKTIPYRLMKPEKIESGQKYPLVLFLHGAGERGTDNVKQLVHGVPEFASKENRQKFPCFLIAPQCPPNTKWVDVDWSASSHRQPVNMTEPARLTLALVDALLTELPVDNKRIYITGLSMGGYGTWDLIARRPDFFAAAAPVCGGGDEGTAEKIKHLPLWAFHGEKDTVVKPARTRNMIAALEKAGGKPKVTIYPNEGHASWVPAYKDPEFYRWLFDQKRD